MAIVYNVYNVYNVYKVVLDHRMVASLEVLNYSGVRLPSMMYRPRGW